MTDASTIAAALPDYEIGGEIGTGGMGAVLGGRHRRLGREVAIKELAPRLTNDAEVRRRFSAEARLLASLRHTHIVATLDYVERDGHCLLVMERLPGGTLWSQFKAQGVSAETACAVVLATCAGLQYAHAHGVLHRDLKPENLLFSADRVLKVTDFGIAKVIGGRETLATRGGEVVGTPAYLAPELVAGFEPAATADVYAAGVMLYELLSGRLPYSDEGGTLAVVRRVVYEDPLDLEAVAPEVPAPIVNATMQAISRSTEERFPNAEAFRSALGDAAAVAWGPDWQARADLAIASPVPVAGAATDGETRVRPLAAEHASGIAPANMAMAELVPVREMIPVPPAPVAAVVAALVLVLVAAALVILGLGTPAPEVVLPPGAVTVAGTDVSGGGVVELDLAKPLDVAIAVLPEQAAGADAVQLGFRVGGVPLPASGVGSFGRADGVKTTTVEATSARFLAAGELTADVRLFAGGEEVARSEFRARPKGSPFLTVPGGVTIVLMLVMLACAEALVRPWRRGDRQVSGTGGLAVLGAVLGAVLVNLGWMMGAPEPRVPTLVLCAALGAGAGFAAAMAARQAGMRARMKAPSPPTENA